MSSPPKNATYNVGDSSSSSSNSSTAALATTRTAAAAAADDILLASSDGAYCWPDVISAVVKRRRLRCVQQTPNSAKQLHKAVGYFSDGKIVPHEVEAHLLEAFCQDDYDGKLHLTTIHYNDNDDDDDTNNNAALGLVFWREVPEEEMREWIDYEKLMELASEQERRRIDAAEKQQKLLLSESCSVDDDAAAKNHSINEKTTTTTMTRVTGDNDEILMSADGNNNEQTTTGITSSAAGSPVSSEQQQQQALVAVRNASLAAFVAMTVASQTQAASRSIPPDSVTHAWVKIELLAVRPRWWGQRIGTLLLACAMREAWLDTHHSQRVVLHIAGGTNNVPAVRLYERLGFVPATPGLFHKPNKDIYVLGNIGLALQNLLWSETLQVPPTNQRLL